MLAQQGAVDRAAAELQAAVDSTDATIFLATLGWALGVAGRVEETERVLDELRARAARDYVSPICFALVHAGLRDRPITVERLRQAIEERSPFAIWMKVDPIFDQFRGDPGFEALLHSLY